MRPTPTVLPALVVVLSGIVAATHIGKIPPAIPVLREALGLSLVEAGFLISCVQIAGMFVGVLAGLAADAIGPRRSVITGQMLLAGCGLAALAATRPVELLVLRALEGLGFLLCILPAPGLIRRLVPAHRLAFHLGLWGTYMGTGTALILVAAPLLLDNLHWNGLWGCLGGLSAVAAFAVHQWIPPDPADAKTAPERRWTHDARQRLTLTLTRFAPWCIALIFAMYALQWISVVGFLPYLYREAGLSGQTAGTLTALACLVNITGNLSAGRLLQRGIAPRHLLHTGFLTMALMCFLAFSPSTAAHTWLRYLAVLLFSAVGGLIPGTMFSLAVHAAPNEHTVATTVGWMQQCAACGQFAGPPLVAWLAAQSGGWHHTWLVTGAASLIGMALASRLRLRTL